MTDSCNRLAARGYLEDGSWELTKDGMLHVNVNGKILARSNFQNVKFNAKHLVISGNITEIEDRTFESCHELETVEFRVEELPKIGVNAFAYCSKLQSIILPDGMALPALALFTVFNNTPIAYKLFDFDNEADYEESSNWNRFVEALENGVVTLYSRREGESFDLEKSLDTICDGCETGDPIMLFLGARFANYVAQANMHLVEDDLGRTIKQYPFTFSRKLNHFPYQNDFPFLSEEEVRDLYIRAAESGSIHALFWCAWCYAEGRAPFVKNPEESSCYLKKSANLIAMAENSIYLGDYLRMRNLALFFADRLEGLDDHAYDIDWKEDCNVMTKAPRINPCWKELCYRIDYLDRFAKCLGVITGFSSTYHFWMGGKIKDYDINTEQAWITWCKNALSDV